MRERRLGLWLGLIIHFGTTENTELHGSSWVANSFFDRESGELGEWKTWVEGLGFEFSASRRAAEAQRFFMRVWIGAGCVDSRVPSSLDIPCCAVPSCLAAALAKEEALAKHGWLLDIRFSFVSPRGFHPPAQGCAPTRYLGFTSQHDYLSQRDCVRTVHVE